MASEVGMMVRRGFDIPMLQGPLRRSKQKELPYHMTRRFRHHDPFVVGDMVWLQAWGPRPSPVKEIVKVIGFDYATDPAQLKFEVASADINPFWPIEFCKLADLVPIFPDVDDLPDFGDDMVD